MESGEILVIDDVHDDERHYQKVDHSSGFQTRSILAVPLFSRPVALGSDLGETKEKIIGGLEALNKIGGSFTDNDQSILQTLANQAATILEIARLYSESRELFMDVVKALTAAIDAKDPYTEGHSHRVSEFATEIAKELVLDPSQIHQLRIGSLLHDVGKIGIPDAILLKSGKLDDEEYRRMKEHAVIGAKILRSVRTLSEGLPATEQHHERLDGKGYPKQLLENQITLFGRIVAVADVFDAMTSNRPYRAALSPQEAFEYLISQADTQFDKQCVQAMIRAYSNGKILTQDDREIITNGE